MGNQAVVAALNNAAWCAAVWASHGLPVERAQGMTFTRAVAPPLYPNLVTTDPSADIAEQTARIAALATETSMFSVKDSFARLPLREFGFSRLFEARWIWRDASGVDRNPIDEANWSRIEREDALKAWERGWRRDDDAPMGLFKPALLTDAGITIVGRTDASGTVTAGAIGYVDSGVLGVTNVFGDPEEAISALLVHAPASTVVGYERSDALRSARRRHFQAVGSLRVWVSTDDLLTASQ